MRPFDRATSLPNTVASRSRARAAGAAAPTRTAAPPPAVATRSRRRRGASVLVVALALSGCAGRDKTTKTEDGVSAADKHYDVAVASFHNGMFEDAKLQLEKALAVDPKHADSYYLRGVLLLNEGKSILDAVEIQQCLEDEAAVQQRKRAQTLHRQAGEAFDAAAQYYEEGAAGRGRAYNSLAVVDLQFESVDKAVDHARAALREKFYSDRYSALSNLGWAFYVGGDLVSATAELRQAVLLNPDYCVGRYRLAQVYLDSGQPEQALEQAQAVVDSDRCPIQDAHRVLGAARLRLGLGEEAQQAFTSCVELAPRSCLAQQCQRLLGAEPKNDEVLARGHGDEPQG
ncbi:MAG: tetratricopeptide repeat protein [Nannocystaceae bacterium]|nr:tetratricopeptide repeat protein [Nannocystaceae bacterium]